MICESEFAAAIHCACWALQAATVKPFLLPEAFAASAHWLSWTSLKYIMRIVMRIVDTYFPPTKTSQRRSSGFWKRHCRLGIDRCQGLSPQVLLLLQERPRTLASYQLLQTGYFQQIQMWWHCYLHWPHCWRFRYCWLEVVPGGFGLASWTVSDAEKLSYSNNSTLIVNLGYWGELLRRRQLLRNTEEIQFDTLCWCWRQHWMHRLEHLFPSQQRKLLPDPSRMYFWRSGQRRMYWSKYRKPNLSRWSTWQKGTRRRYIRVMMSIFCADPWLKEAE